MFRRRRSPFRRRSSGGPRLQIALAGIVVAALIGGTFYFAGVADRDVPERREVRIEVTDVPPAP